MNKSNFNNMIVLAALYLLLPADAFASDVVTSKHLFQKDQRLELKLRECENGRPPLLIAHQADPLKLIGSSINVIEHFMLDKTRYFTVGVEEDTEGVIAQFCDPKAIKPYFDNLKISNTK